MARVRNRLEHPPQIMQLGFDVFTLAKWIEHRDKKSCF